MIFFPMMCWLWGKSVIIFFMRKIIIIILRRSIVLAGVRAAVHALFVTSPRARRARARAGGGGRYRGGEAGAREHRWHQRAEDLRGFWEWRSVFLLITEYEARVPMRVTFPQVNARDGECVRVKCAGSAEWEIQEYTRLRLHLEEWVRLRAGTVRVRVEYCLLKWISWNSPVRLVRIQTRLRLCSGFAFLSLSLSLSPGPHLRKSSESRGKEKNGSEMCVFWAMMSEPAILPDLYEWDMKENYWGTPGNKACARALKYHTILVKIIIIVWLIHKINSTDDQILPAQRISFLLLNCTNAAPEVSFNELL